MTKSDKKKSRKVNPVKVSSQNSGRIRKLQYKDKRRSVKLNEPIPSSYRILMGSVKQVWHNRRLFLGVMIVYAALYILLVRGLATGFQLPDIKEAVSSTEIGTSKFFMGLTLVGTMYGSLGTTSSEVAAVYQAFLFVFISLVLIWSLRQTSSSTRERVKIKEALYSSTGPLVQYMVVWLIVLLQLVPALIGFILYGLVISNGIVVGFFEHLLWLIILAVAVLITVFLVSSSVFATYIASLPGVAPMEAIKKAKLVVKFRRFSIIRKAIAAPILILVLSLLVFFPLVLMLPLLAEGLFMAYSFLLILFGHAYYYNLYRSLI